MDNLKDLVNLLNSQDLKVFKAELRRRNKRLDTKNFQLLKLLETDDIKDEKKIYSDAKNKDSYHALRKRLSDNLIEFLSNRTYMQHNRETHEALRLLVVSRFLMENDVAKIAYRCLNKAERIAKEFEQFTVLQEILLLRLQYAHLNREEDLELLNLKIQENLQKIQQEAKLNFVYALFRKRLQEIHLEGKIIKLDDFIDEIIKVYDVRLQEMMSYKSLYHLLFIVNEYAAIQQNYTLIQGYAKTVNRFLRQQDYSSRQYLYYRLYILYYMANFSLRNREFKESQEYLEEMSTLMEQENRKYYVVFHLRLVLLKALNLHFTDHSDLAVEILESTLGGNLKKAKQEDMDDLRLSLTMIYAQHLNKKSLKNLAQFNHTNAWYEKKLGMLWTIRKNIMEILIYAQFDELELAQSRLKGVRRRYKSYLKQVNEERVLLFLTLVEKFLTDPNAKRDKLFREETLNLIRLPENQDIFSLSFTTWLLASLDTKKPFDLMLSFL